MTRNGYFDAESVHRTPIYYEKGCEIVVDTLKKLFFRYVHVFAFCEMNKQSCRIWVFERLNEEY